MMDHKARFLAHLRTGTAGREVKAITGDLSTGNGGAYVLPKLLADAIASAPAPAHAIPGLVARTRASAPDYSEPVETGAPIWHWLGDDAGDEAPTIGTVVPTVGEIRVEFEVSRNLLADSAFDLESFFVARASVAFAEAEALAFLAGDGIKRPTGLVEAIAVTPAAGSLAASILALRNSVPIQHRAHWVMPGAVFDLLDGLAAFRAADNHGPARLHGIPVLIDEACQRSGVEAEMDGETVITPAVDPAGLVLLGNLGTAYRAVDIAPAKAASAVEVMLDPYSRSGWVKVSVGKRVAGITRDAAAVSGIEVALP